MLPFQRSLVTGDHRQQQDQRRLPEQQSSPNPPTIVPVADIRVISPQSSTSSPIQKSAKKQASLARIAVPSFSAFKSQASSIPRKPTNKSKTQLDQNPQASPRHFSFAAEPSPRLVHRISRPLSEHGAPVSTSADQSNGYDLSSASPSITNPLNSTSHAFPHDRNASIDSVLSDRPGEEQRNPAQKSMNGLKPSMTLEFNGVQRQLSNESLNSEASDKRSKSPSRLGAFFGWKSTPTPSKGAASPTTSFSEHSSSPGSSPKAGKDNRSMARPAPAGLDIPRANDARYLDSPDTPIHVGTPEMQTHIQELERELSHISAELAGSIRREMDLEDEVDRLRQELPSVPPSELSRRGSDYFSDSGAGSVRYPISDPDAKIEEVEKSRRKAEQDKAQMKIDVAAKLQTELARRRELEEHVSHLEDQLERRSHEDTDRKDRRVEQLEAQLEDVKRKLVQEKEAKQNFEDLYTALQSEFSSGRKYGGRGFSSIAEEGSELSRSGSLARSGSMRGGSLTRSGSVKGEGRGRSGSVSVPLTIENFKEIEDQRDALHKALKLLISRHDKQQKDHERHIKKMTRANQVGSNRQRTGYQREVSHLKEEVTTLRKRTEDALDQKWQYEKSLGGIKMDLDRAEQETRGLRNLLQEHDIAAPSPITISGRFPQSEITSPTGILSSASFDRDQAHRLASEFRQRLDMMQQSNASPTQIGELRQAADRMDQLSKQFDRQVNANTALRDRLAAAVEKGEKEQNSSTRQIEEMQKRLAGMEDDLLAAQQHSENTLTTHETEVRAIEEATSPRLQRFNVDGAEQSALKKSPSQGLLRSKTVSHKKVAEATLLDASRTQKLERQVRELERLLRDAEDDMQYVVTRVNKSQLEVAELTNERDAALIQMRKLQDKLVEETERAEGLMGGHDSGSDYGD